MYKKGQQLQTALEARRFMVAHPGCRVKDSLGYLWKFDILSTASFVRFDQEQELWQTLACLDNHDAPFTIIDEPQYHTADALGDAIKSSMVTADKLKQPVEWVRVTINPDSGQTHKPLQGFVPVSNKPAFIFDNERSALQHICQLAQQVRITWPEWSIYQVPHEYTIGKETELYWLMIIEFALRNKATVEYLPRVSEQPKEGL